MFRAIPFLAIIVIAYDVMSAIWQGLRDRSPKVLQLTILEVPPEAFLRRLREWLTISNPEMRKS